MRISDWSSDVCSSDLQGIRRVEALFSHQVSNQLNFVGARTVQLTAIDHFEVPGEVEVAGDFPGEDPRFGGGNVQLPTLATQGFQQRPHTVEDAVFVQPRAQQSVAS